MGRNSDDHPCLCIPGVPADPVTLTLHATTRLRPCSEEIQEFARSPFSRLSRREETCATLQPSPPRFPALKCVRAYLQFRLVGDRHAPTLLQVLDTLHIGLFLCDFARQRRLSGHGECSKRLVFYSVNYCYRYF